MKFEVVLGYLMVHGVAEVRADTCSDPPDPPVWLVVLDAVAPCVGIVASFSYFCVVRCCTARNKKYFRKILRWISLANWLFFVASIVFLILSCEGVRLRIFGFETVTEWVFIGAMCFCWLVMMIESYVCREGWYIKHLGKRQDVLERIEKFKDTEPKIMWSVVGYNIETRNIPVRTITLPCTTPTVQFTEPKVHKQSVLGVLVLLHIRARYVQICCHHNVPKIVERSTPFV